MGWDEWQQFVEWEKTIPNRFDPKRSVPGSDYNLHHNIVEATAEEIARLRIPTDPDDLDAPERWYAIAEPIRDVYDSYDRCKKDLEGKRGRRRGPVEVTNAAEGWAILNGGVRLTPGFYAFTDANELGGVGVVLLRVGDGEAADHVFLMDPAPSTVERVLDDAPVQGLTAAEVSAALRRFRNIFSEMVALYQALSQLTRLPEVVSGSQVTIVHDYLGVAAWMAAGRPAGSMMSIDHGFSDHPAFPRPDWRPAKDAAIGAIVAACWDLTLEKDLRLVFRHQPSHRSEAAGDHHFVRYNLIADQLAERGAPHPRRLSGASGQE